MTKLFYLGHSAFYIETNDKEGIIIDPFLSGNPLANFDYRTHNINYIFVTHAHSDHLGDSIEISKVKNAPVYAVFELANYCALKGIKSVGVNIGGKLDFSWGSVKFFNAIHSSSNQELKYGGLAASLLFKINDKYIYHAGDTSLMSEFSLIGKIYNIDYAIVPVGGFYTMNVEDASLAAKMLNAKHIIPMHYNTFPPIKADISKFNELINQNEQKPVILKVNEYVEL